MAPTVASRRGTPRTVTPHLLLVAAFLVLEVNVVTSALVLWELDGGGPAGRIVDPAPFPDSSSRRRAPRAWSNRVHHHRRLPGVRADAT
ncbi:hypothetical protein [Modestobacter excelsi]|uniref:hypothetical protein n=1 Tax=Modestobacter excelsi TaxID=2213161 RepID=UPI00110CB319|nr:hypothetical protein [Modestobacter excelsi]